MKDSLLCMSYTCNLRHGPCFKSIRHI